MLKRKMGEDQRLLSHWTASAKAFIALESDHRSPCVVNKCLHLCVLPRCKLLPDLSIYRGVAWIFRHLG